MIAFLRAVFSLQGSQPQLDDQYAPRFLRSPLLRLLYGLGRSRQGHAALMNLLSLALRDSHLYIPLRTLYIDSVLEHHLRGLGQQVVILGAGYDTRAFRAAERYPDVLYIEVDLPATQAVKRRRMGEHPAVCSKAVRLVAADVRRPGWTETLREAGLRDDLPTLFIAEGLLPYLTPSEVDALFQSVAELGRLSERCTLVFTYLAKRTTSIHSGICLILAPLHRPSRESFSSEFEHGELALQLKERGFTLTEDLDFPALYRSFLGYHGPRERFAIPFRVALTVLQDPCGKEA